MGGGGGGARMHIVLINADIMNSGIIGTHKI